MSEQATGMFEITSWDERPYVEGDEGRKLTRASVTQHHSGDVDGDAVVEYLMSYQPDGTASFVTLQRFDGAVAGRRGTFVLQGEGGFADGVAHAPLRIVDGSGTGELAGIAGHGHFRAKGHDTEFALDYDLT
jgi:hypothetical protein